MTEIDTAAQVSNAELRAMILTLSDQVTALQNQLNRWEKAGMETFEKAKGNPMLAMMFPAGK